MGISDTEKNMLDSDNDYISSFENNLKFNDGMYETKLFWEDKPSDLENNWAIAKLRFGNLSIKMQDNNWLYNEYKNIVKDQIKENIVEECSSHFETNSYYMPHSAVVRKDKETTKVRMVFDASSKGRDCKSLNKRLYAGPPLNPRIIDVILRFREYEHAFCGDIQGTFLTIGITEKDRDYLRFFWFPNDGDVKSYKIMRMNRVPFGVTLSPFILAATIKFHIRKYKGDYRETYIYELLNTSLYVDDLFAGSSESVNKAFDLSKNSIEILKDANKGCFFRDNLVALHFKYDQARCRFVEWAQNEIAVVPDFHKRILFSDEVHFWLNGYVNKQNCRIWSEANPQVYVETPLHPEKLTLWCALWAARATIDLLKDTFGDRLISRFGPVNWPPRSCDLTPLSYFLWGYVKSLVYADKPQTLDHLEDNIRRVIADIRPQMLEKVIENWTSRLDYIRASRGSPMPEIIFKIEKISDLGKIDSLGIKDLSEKKSKLELQDLALKHFENTVFLFDYEKVFVDWEKEGIIEKIAQYESKDGGKFHYLPHRPVFKENSTTKIRPVFDGSAHHGKSCSLNDCVEKGPILIEMIPVILNRFLLGKIGVTSDIRKAFFQISLHEHDMNFLRFLWREGGNFEKPVIYRETESKEVTKRRILSLAHRFFYPIGFTCPIILITELLIQECWKIETSWNSKLQIDIERKFEVEKPTYRDTRPQDSTKMIESRF
ncbi:reverse transcriptase domain-containing protein [Trichonephila clavipes]|nr:reverse transcriptase domain-containing protein [Trichonephila clavipes]